MQPAVVLADHQQHAVVDALAADFPGLLRANGVLIHGLGLRGRNHQDGDLGALALLELEDRLLEGRALLRVERPGQVGHRRLQRRDRGLRERKLRERGPNEQKPT
jgi:hypothetical protein